MKIYKNLYPQICAFDNLYLAFRKARLGKRGRPDVAAFEQDLELELPQLQEELLTESYRPAATGTLPSTRAKGKEDDHAHA
jgi:RNA-directed DNA polymerase